MAKTKEVKKSIEEVIKELNKEYGGGSVIHGNETKEYSDVISTGSIGLDRALGIGGLPKSSGKIVEIYGWESSGKSTLTQTIIGNFQKAGVKCLLVDGEDSLDATYATALGVNLKELYVIQLDEYAGEGAYNKMEKLVETGEIGLVVIDSYNSLQPSKIVNGEVGDSTMGLHARMLNQAVMKTNTLASKHNVLFIFIGQLREKIGVMYGSPETTQGGNALRFYAHVRLKVSRSTTKDNSVMSGDVKLGNLTKVKVEKNKLGAPFQECEFNIIYGEGIDKIQDVIDVASEDGIIKKYGKSITFEEVKYDADEFKKLLIDNVEFQERLRNIILNPQIETNEPTSEIQETA